MTSKMGLGSVNCTSCGAGLSVLGGGRVETHVCGYCGAVLDAQDNYREIANIGKRNHPDSPVQIGQSLTLEGVEFTVIGTLGMVERYGGREWRWVEHQLFSPTHGYLWLNVEDGHLSYTRKIRDYNMSAWLSPATVERSETPPIRVYKTEQYRYYDTTVAEIDFMEGEFNWVPKLGEKTTSVNLLGPDAMLTLTKSKTEREVELTRLLPRAETARDLGFDEAALGPVGQAHPLAPYVPMPEERLLRRVLAGVAVVAAVLGMIFWFSGGRVILESPYLETATLPQIVEFEIDNTAQLAQLQFRTTFNNQWATFGTELRDPDGEVILTGERTVSFYSGRSGGESWSEGSRRSTIRFRPTQPGTYRASLVQVAASNPGSGTVSMRVSQGKPTGFWLIGLAVIAGLGWLAVTARSAAHKKRRFAGSDWND
ncbi:DUF4178 domain-containing protein [Gymnodinialimonas ceratoperidinii]|uniref:DUF4178 domain-containing protein n=1 Tax=Gymnodinialimonas ceratoperidinii TaxID=2856823 RepID=A0A8F6YBF1_9RHOB|nr:DUF4178 domain-containing protein [Gymnodinialimonas ceratoperidinii]QXT40493.1 DUF4178 domain-containing protein [Gymnodinialimonas ceratoperidinii]